ncbi:MAG: Holliday junction resolvase RuvX [Coriobacteriia bacterium]
MRVLGLDIGEKRIGVAVSDPSGRVATPLAVLDAVETMRDGGELRRIIEDYEIETIVVGLPLSLDGTEGSQAEAVRRAARRLARFLPVPIEYGDERLSSVEARRTMGMTGLSEAEMRGRVDMVAAALFLQTYLDSRR